MSNWIFFFLGSFNSNSPVSFIMSNTIHSPRILPLREAASPLTPSSPPLPYSSSAPPGQLSEAVLCFLLSLFRGGRLNLQHNIRSYVSRSTTVDVILSR